MHGAAFRAPPLPLRTPAHTPGCVQLGKALQRDCDLYETGIKIITIRVTKPRIPDAVRNNYEDVEKNKARLLVAAQEQAVISKKEETLRIQEKIRAEKEAEIAKINAEKEAAVTLINAQSRTAEEEARANRAALVSRINLEMQLLEKEAAVWTPVCLPHRLRGGSG